ncbi:glycoside hydrolase 97-domain-containing protein [Russula earlei]|uniref:Glycoside hydrolase 97-domain-containing protein n=1 Tax=Russula earlei TaxID=71964 RepID=A0ACC0TQM1_9AGAM|nr:glycoside hydrolase 97-domain-containing protein [Russula earlei]
MDEAKTGWSKTNPSYEESYEQAIPVGATSPTRAGWVFPALFQTGDDWLLITEAAVDRHYCASRLQPQSPDGEYHIGFPDPREVFPGGNANPESSLPWFTPWRIIAIGSLQTIVGSTLGTDLARPAMEAVPSFVKPGKASWSWILLKDDSTVYSVQKRYIDYAADMHWQYCLIDADWDRKIGYDSAQLLTAYAKTKNVGIWLWYNSSGEWNTTPYSPKSKLLTHEDRAKEFARLQQMGIKGVKVDFFGGDGQSMINYYIDIMEDAAKYHLMVNFHGATLPRGWERTYPNLMTMEAIKGLEMVTFEQKNADAEPTHAAMQPFTRNAFDPMDFTPLSLYKIPRINRKTTSAFELALSVVFTSGVQHFAEGPTGMEHVPLYVKDFLREVPVYWDETKLIDGYPGKLVVIARRSGKRWYVAGINGEDTEKTVALDLSFLSKITNKRKGTIITDGDGKEDVLFYMAALQASSTGPTRIAIKGNGLVLGLTAGKGFAQDNKVLTVKANTRKATIQPTMWGIFFEDINLAADGGIYAELVKNRSFEFTTPMMGWKEQSRQTGNTLILNRGAENPANPRFARQGTNNSIQAELVNAKGEVIGEASVTVSGGDWKKYTVSFTATATEAKAKLNVWFDDKGVTDVDMISLFPKNTWKNRPGGLRADLVQWLADLKPGFIRFPGGCIVEGRDLANRYQWKKTVGNLEDRQLIINRWNTEFANRSTPDYFQSFGLGFYEYFQLAEDIGAQPLPILNCGMACQFNTAEAVATDDLAPYIQDALDLVEFANESTTTKWGKLRADMGHPAPFNLTLMGVGNENWGPQYIERLAIFSKAIKEKYPAIQLVNSSGTDPVGDRFDYLNGELRKMHADLIDEHYYKPPEWFTQNARRYDNYDRNGSKVFAGEYAAHTKLTNDADKKNNWQSALAEAAYMTGLERNADVVYMASYAPLFAHIDGWQWAPDLIWFDNLHSYGTPNYYVQQLFSVNKGTAVVPILSGSDVIAGQDSLYATACMDEHTHELIIKLVNTAGKEVVKEIALEGVKQLAAQGVVTVLSNEQLSTYHSFASPQVIAPKQEAIPIRGKKVEVKLPAYSLSVIRVKMNV